MQRDIMDMLSCNCYAFFFYLSAATIVGEIIFKINISYWYCGKMRYNCYLNIKRFYVG